MTPQEAQAQLATVPEVPMHRRADYIFRILEEFVKQHGFQTKRNRAGKTTGGSVAILLGGNYHMYQLTCTNPARGAQLRCRIDSGRAKLEIYQRTSAGGYAFAHYFNMPDGAESALTKLLELQGADRASLHNMPEPVTVSTEVFAYDGRCPKYDCDLSSIKWVRMVAGQKDVFTTAHLQAPGKQPFWLIAATTYDRRRRYFVTDGEKFYAANGVQSKLIGERDVAVRLCAPFGPLHPFDMQLLQEALRCAI